MPAKNVEVNASSLAIEYEIVYNLDGGIINWDQELVME